MSDTLELTIHSIAVEICRMEPNIDQAIAKLRRKLAPRREELMSEMYEAALRRAVHLARGSVMRSVKGEAAPQGSRVVGGMKDGAAAFDRGFLASWHTPSGGKLKDATGSELGVFAANERGLAVGHEKNARFYEALAAKVGADQKVGEVLSDKEAKAMWLRAEKAPNDTKASSSKAIRPAAPAPVSAVA